MVARIEEMFYVASRHGSERVHANAHFVAKRCEKKKKKERKIRLMTGKCVQ